jgi:hypothetical protein
MAALLVYFVPTLVSALQPLSILDLLYFNVAFNREGVWSGVGPQPYALAAATMAVSLVCLALSLAAVRRSWRIDASKRVLCWSLALLVLALWGAAAMKIGVNMTVERRIELGSIDRADRIMNVWLRQGNGFVTRWHRDFSGLNRYRSDLSRLTASTRAATLSPPGSAWEFPKGDPNYESPGFSVAWSDDSPRRAYVLMWATSWSRGDYVLSYLRLHTILFDANDCGRELGQVDLLEHIKPGTGGFWLMALHVRKGQLYAVVRGSLAVMSLQDPNAPAV